MKRFHYDDHAHLEAHLADFIGAYNFGRRLKTLKGLTPYEIICKVWTSEPERFRLNPTDKMPGLNTYDAIERENQSVYFLQRDLHCHSKKI